MINWLKNLFNKRNFGVARSPRWQTVRKDFLILHPSCAVCGTTKDLEVHHILPFHIDTSLELKNSNLLTLCNVHHFWHAHLGSWKSYNNTVVEDAKYWLGKIQQR